MLATAAVAFVAVGGGIATAGAAGATPTPIPRPAPMATGSVALSGPAQYVSFSAFPQGRYHGSVDYANFTVRAAHTNVWNVMGTHPLTFFVGPTKYAHTMKATSITPLSTHSTSFTGIGTFNADPTHYAWTISGTVNWNAISFKIVYTGADKGYNLSGFGWIRHDGSVFGTARDSNGKVLPFTMPRGSAFQVLRFTSPVAWASVFGHGYANFGYTVPWWLPRAGTYYLVKVHDGGPGFQFDTFAQGVAFWRFIGPVFKYQITSGNIYVRR